MTGIILMVAACSGATRGIDLSGSAAYRFDGIAAMIWDVEAGIGASPAAGLALGGRVLYLDATQNPIQGIRRLHGRIVTGLADVSWHTLNNKLLVEGSAGVEAILGWTVRPTGNLSTKISLPLPVNPVFQNLALTPSGWYRHRMPNGAAISNHIASHGYAAELGATMGTKGAIAFNFQQEYLTPAPSVLDTSFLGPWPETGAISDTLGTNAITSFYAYLYRQLFKPLYVGYAFSWTDSRFDRRVFTSGEDAGPAMPPQYKTQSAVYPYPTPTDMLAHIVSISLRFSLHPSVSWTSNVAFPFYSKQDISYMPDTVDVYRFHNEKDFGSYELPFSGPLTLESNVTWNVSARTGLTLAYHFFGFPYLEWAYFTKDSYSLHTMQLSVKQRF
ncbi:MAG: hypothetical protein GF418_14445 [Chitinivibrionales bacterium]|nr:hypothetical protein [Chitinivibrionales bacterium]